MCVYTHTHIHINKIFVISANSYFIILRLLDKISGVRGFGVP